MKPNRQIAARAIGPGLLGLVYAEAFIDRALVAVAGGPIKQDLALSDTQFGLVSGTAFALLFCLSSLPMGWLADRVDRRRMIVVGLLFWSVMTASCGLAQTWPQFCLARIGVGLGEACLLPAGMSLIANSIAPQKRARAVAMFLMGATSGNALAFLAGGYLLTLNMPWRTLFLGAALLGLPLAGVLAMRQEPVRGPQPDLGSGPLRHISIHLKAYGLLTGAAACCIALTQTQAIWIPQFFSRRFGLSPGDSALLIGAIFLLSAPAGQWAGGRTIDHLKIKGLGAPANSVLAACCGASMLLAALFYRAGALIPTAIAYTLFNFTIFAATPAGLSGWQALTPARSQGLTIAVLTSIATLAGLGLGPLTVGILADRWSLEPALLALILGAATIGCTLSLLGRAAFASASRTAPFT